eukprot:TRINITY_DN4670_c0_g1_i3.p1 TRINITY_DN4670_c0_g1~~TRINITY_DN4670_c0_g1_i3.p1  ORF type:complete len:401 (-),score=130.49 TRINITY_DN4670_c0_g1_i3:180-1382(-)
MILVLVVIVTIAAGFWYFRPSSSKTADWKKAYVNFKSLKAPKVATTMTGKRYLITGGHGCLGSHLVEALLARGETDVTIFDWSPSNLFQGDSRVRFIRGDIRDASAVNAALKGIDVVFHVAAMMNYWSNKAYDYQPSYEVNVQGTENVIEACVANGVKQLLYTSSVAVVTALHDQKLENVPEDVPYPTAPYFSNYSRTKGLAEQAVLAANGRNGLKTAALRIDGAVWGPRDIVMLYFLVEDLVEGKTAHIAPGLPTLKAGYAFAPNLAHGHLCLERTLWQSTIADGQVYNLQDQVFQFGPFVHRLCTACGVGVQWLPPSVLYALACVMELLQWIARGRLTGNLSKLSRSSIKYLLINCWLNGDKARRELGYAPVYTIDEALQVTAEFRDVFGKAWKAGSL